MESPKSEQPQPNKRRRGRPPIDDYDQNFTAPKITKISAGNNDEGYSNDAMSSSDQDLSVWEDEPTQQDEAGEREDKLLKIKTEMVSQLFTYKFHFLHLLLYFCNVSNIVAMKPLL